MKLPQLYLWLKRLHTFLHINPHFSLSYQCFQYSNLFVFLSLPVSTILFRYFKSDFYFFVFGTVAFLFLLSFHFSYTLYDRTHLENGRIYLTA